MSFPLCPLQTDPCRSVPDNWSQKTIPLYPPWQENENRTLVIERKEEDSTKGWCVYLFSCWYIPHSRCSAAAIIAVIARGNRHLVKGCSILQGSFGNFIRGECGIAVAVGEILLVMNELFLVREEDVSGIPFCDEYRVIFSLSVVINFQERVCVVCWYWWTWF